MEPVSVMYLGTDLLEIKNDIKLDIELRAKHYQYVSPSLICDVNDNTASFSVNISSQFEHSNPILSYRLRTKSEFKCQNFVLHEDRYSVLEDYVFFAYRKHIDILREKLTCQNYINKIKLELEPFQYEKSIEMILDNQIRDNKLLSY